MEPVLAILIRIGLAAACGFRIFVSFLVISVAANSGHLALSPGFEWIGTEVAIATFLVATILEIGAYYVPFLDNLLDSVATPAFIPIIAFLFVLGLFYFIWKKVFTRYFKKSENRLT